MMENDQDWVTGRTPREEIAHLRKRVKELESVAVLSTSNLVRRYKKQCKQSPFGQWHAAPVGSHIADRWVENELGKHMREIVGTS